MLMLALGVGVLLAWLVLTARSPKFGIPLNVLILSAVIVRVVTYTDPPTHGHGCGMGAIAALFVYGIIGFVAFLAALVGLCVHLDRRKAPPPPLPRAVALTTSSGDPSTDRLPPSPRSPQA